MAKKKGKREEGFTFPEFDKDEFRQKELRDSKVILFAVFYEARSFIKLLRFDRGRASC